MLEKYKDYLLHGYSKMNIQSNIVFRQINGENGYETDVEKDGGDIVFDYMRFNDGFTVFAAIPELMRVIKDFAVSFGDDLFSPKAFKYLFDYLETSFITKYPRWLYKEDNAQDKYMLYYGISDINKLNHSKIQQSTVQCTTNSPYKNITDEYKPFERNNTYFGTLIGNEIVSIAGTNGIRHEVVSIGIDTLSQHRQKGCAASNVTAITAHLLNSGRLVEYNCNNVNTASIKTAVSCGFELVAESKTIWCPSNNV